MYTICYNNFVVTVSFMFFKPKVGRKENYMDQIVQEKVKAIRNARKELVEKQRENLKRLYYEYLESLRPEDLLGKKLCIYLDTGFERLFEENVEYAKQQWCLGVSERIFNINLKQRTTIVLKGEIEL